MTDKAKEPAARRVSSHGEVRAPSRASAPQKPARRPPNKASSSELSTLASQYIAIDDLDVRRLVHTGQSALLAEIIRKLAASVLSQDEVEGQ